MAGRGSQSGPLVLALMGSFLVGAGISAVGGGPQARASAGVVSEAWRLEIRTVTSPSGADPSLEEKLWPSEAFLEYPPNQPDPMIFIGGNRDAPEFDMPLWEEPQ